MTCRIIKNMHIDVSHTNEEASYGPSLMGLVHQGTAAAQLRNQQTQTHQCQSSRGIEVTEQVAIPHES